MDVEITTVQSRQPLQSLRLSLRRLSPTLKANAARCRLEMQSVLSTGWEYQRDDRRLLLAIPPLNRKIENFIDDELTALAVKLWNRFGLPSPTARERIKALL